MVTLSACFSKILASVVSKLRSHLGTCKSWSCSEHDVGRSGTKGALGRSCLPAWCSLQDPVQICLGVTSLVLACVVQLLRTEIRHWVPCCFDPASKPLLSSPTQKPSDEKSPDCRQKMIPEVVSAQEAGAVPASLLWILFLLFAFWGLGHCTCVEWELRILYVLSPSKAKVQWVFWEVQSITYPSGLWTQLPLKTLGACTHVEQCHPGPTWNSQRSTLKRL